MAVELQVKVKKQIADVLFEFVLLEVISPKVISKAI